MFSHVMLGTNNLSESIAFYDRVMPTLGYARESTGDTFAIRSKTVNTLLRLNLQSVFRFASIV